MEWITYLLPFVTVIYVAVALLFYAGLYRLNKQPQSQNTPFISVVIAARNEADYIGQCLTCLQQQTYPIDRFEIIVVDDDSTDNTSQIVRTAQISNLRLLTPGNLFSEMAAKKRPMSVGIHHAKGEWILTTDADCTMPPTWIASMAAYMTDDAGVVIGFSQLKTEHERFTFFERLQAFDFLTLLAAAAGAVGIGYPLAASGQNFAYRKTLFDQIGGFSTIAHRPSGDDVLLLQLLRKAWSDRIAFANKPEAFVSTWRSETPSSFWQQRKRWASNAAYQLRLNIRFFAYITTVFGVNALIPTALFFSISPGDLVLPALCLTAKIGVDTLVTIKGASIFKRADLLILLPIWEILQIPYTILVGLAGTLGGFTWKGRQH